MKTYKRKGSGQRGIEKIKHFLPLRLDLNIAKLVSYLAFDGHLSADYRQFLLASKDKELLDDFTFAVRRYNLVPIKKQAVSEWGSCYVVRVFNSSFTRVLELAGAPRGKKTQVPFLVPRWILQDRESTREYLRIAFDCGGSVWKDRYSSRIRFKICKSKVHLANGIHYMEQLRKMLKMFSVETTKVWIVNDENMYPEVVGMCFGIKRKSLKAFKKEINFKVEKKRIRLEQYIST